MFDDDGEWSLFGDFEDNCGSEEVLGYIGIMLMIITMLCMRRRRDGYVLL